MKQKARKREDKEEKKARKYKLRVVLAVEKEPKHPTQMKFCFLSGNKKKYANMQTAELKKKRDDCAQCRSKVFNQNNNNNKKQKERSFELAVVSSRGA